MKKSLVFILVVLALSTIPAACVNSGPTTNLRVDMTDFMFRPADFVVPAGETITLDLTNSGAVIHEFVIMKFGTEVENNFNEKDQANIFWEAELKAGEKGTFTFTAPGEPGKYQIVCGIPGHYTAGMIGSMLVVSE